ncbi:uncharacterized protein LOC144421113 [Styela clava]
MFVVSLIFVLISRGWLINADISADTTTQQVTTDPSTAYSVTPTTSTANSTYITNGSTTRETTTIPVETTKESSPPTTEKTGTISITANIDESMTSSIPITISETTVNAATNDKPNLSEITQSISPTKENSPSNAGPIAGAVVGVFVLLAVIGIAFYFFYKRQKTNEPAEKRKVEKAPVPNGTFNGTYEEVVLDNRKPVILPNNEYAIIDDDGFLPAEDVAGFSVDNEQSKGEDMFYAELDKNKIPDDSNYQQLNLQPVHNQADEADELSSPEDKEASYAWANINI